MGMDFRGIAARSLAAVAALSSAPVIAQPIDAPTESDIVVEAPPAQVVVVEQETTRYRGLADFPTFAWGVPFAPLPGTAVIGPVPERITPLSNPAGRLRGPLVTPLRPRGFTRPLSF